MAKKTLRKKTLKRRTLKIRSLKRRTLKRRTLKRRTLKRRTLKRGRKSLKRSRNIKGGDPFGLGVSEEEKEKRELWDKITNLQDRGFRNPWTNAKFIGSADEYNIEELREQLESLEYRERELKAEESARKMGAESLDSSVETPV